MYNLRISGKLYLQYFTSAVYANDAFKVHERTFCFFYMSGSRDHICTYSVYSYLKFLSQILSYICPDVQNKQSF